MNKNKGILMELSFLSENMSDYTHFEYSKKLRDLINKLDNSNSLEFNASVLMHVKNLDALHRFLY